MNTKISFRIPRSLLNMGILLVVLSTLDSLFTDFGIRHGLIQEANPIMRKVYDTSVFGFHALKISLPMSLLFILTKVDPKPWLRLLLQLALFLYSFVLLLHLFWISQVI